MPATLSILLAACHGASGNLAAQYQIVYNEFHEGNFEGARVKADSVLQQSASRRLPGVEYWQSKLRLLESQILLYQAHPKELLALLTNASFPLAGDLAIERNLLCGRAHYALGQAEESEREMREARRLAEISRPDLLDEVVQNEGSILLASGDLGAAREKFVTSLAMARQQADAWTEGIDLVNISQVDLLRGLYDQALPEALEAERFARANHAPFFIHWAVAKAGWAYQNLGDFEHALTNFQEAERLAQALGLSQPRVIWLQDAGRADSYLGNVAEATRYEQEALQAALQLPAGDETEEIVNTEANLASLLYRQGRYGEARAYSDAATAAARDSKDDNVIAYTRFLQGLLAMQASGGEDPLELLMQARRMTNDLDLQGDIELAVAKWWSERHEMQRAELWYRRSIQTFEHKRASVHSFASRLPAFGYGSTVYRSYAQFLIDSNRPHEALQLLDAGRARTLEEGLGLTAQTPRARVRHATDPEATARKLNASILFYSLGDEQSHLWVVTPHEVRLVTLPRQQDIGSLIKRYQSSIEKGGDPVQTGDTAAASLYNTLIGPVAGLISGGNKVYVIPDGSLHGLNFETLLKPTAGGFKYWVEDVTVTTAGSIRMIAQSSSLRRSPMPKDMLLIGNPIATSEQFPALMHGADEIARVQRHFSSQDEVVLTQAEAIPASYASSNPEQFRYVHFVAHGTASRLSPLDSAVVLSPDAAQLGDFMLHASDILHYPLHARLVTISGCYGSGIRAYAGEGLVGLAWAFLSAGAHNVISALWEVSDDSTPRLMDALYSELAAGQPPDAALRDAKLALIHSDGVYRKPYYWGAFQLYAGS